jgi:hypothetical protein
MGLMHTIVRRVPGYEQVRRVVRRKPVPPRQRLLDMLPKGSVGAEVGVDRGDFSARILAVVRPARLHLIDPWAYFENAEYESARFGGADGGSQSVMDARYEEVRARFAAEIASGQVVFHRALSSEAAAALPNDSLDWVYIDGNHLYEFVRDDLEVFCRKVRPGGLITGDDYGEGGWWDGGVKRAVDEFVAAGRAEAVAFLGRQFVLRRREI